MFLPLESNAPTDFDFEIGNWSVRHRKLKERLKGCDEWIEFDGLSSTRKILGGFGNLEDNQLFLPDAPLRAVALRSWNAATGLWSIWWLDGRFPDALDTPVVGRFNDGVGVFLADDVLNTLPIKVRFTWSASATDSLRWEQAFSADAGQTWETNWTMVFSRVD
jgi:hypothetical protein